MKSLPLLLDCRYNCSLSLSSVCSCKKIQIRRAIDEVRSLGYKPKSQEPTTETLRTAEGTEKNLKFSSLSCHLTSLHSVQAAKITPILRPMDGNSQFNGSGISNQEPQSTTAKLPTEFTLDSKFALITSPPVGPTPIVWKGKASKKDGAISGTLKLPVGFSSDFPSGSAAVSGVLVQDESWGAVTGCGQIKVPAIGPKGSFRTAAIVLGQ